MKAATKRIREVIYHQIDYHRKTLNPDEDRDVLDAWLKKQAEDSKEARFFTSQCSRILPSIDAFIFLECLQMKPFPIS